MRRARTGRAKRPLSFYSTSVARVLFFVPATVLLIVLVVYPVLQTLALSFLGPTSGGFVGFDNYGNVLGRPETIDLRNFNPTYAFIGELLGGPVGGFVAGFLDAQFPLGTLIDNLLWIAIHLPMTLFTGLFLALTLQKVRGASVVKSMVFLGMVTPLIVGGIILRYLFDEKSGIVPQFFGAIGIRSLAIQWTQYPSTLLFGLIFGSVWLGTGFSLIIYSAGLTTIPKDYFEAAQIDGASSWQMFRKITWPLLRPITLVVVTMTVLWELKIFDIVYAATNPNGGVGNAADVLALQMWRYAFRAGNYAEAAVVATLLSGLTLLVASFMFHRMVVGMRGGGSRPSLFARLLRIVRRPS